MSRKFNPALTEEQAKVYVTDAHLHQFRHTFNLGSSLRWDGFTLLFNLLCGTTNSRLYTTFRSYAKKYPKLGLTPDEFRNLLINECNWKPKDCRPSVLQALMQRHDFHHRAFKKYAAQNKPFEYQVADKLFSYAGFISFLRSRDNSAIDPEHETVYQDMTQPLSHYFINSSHNTYLEGDQLRGKSSTDAYIRALLQGCRCVEIDCWDDTLNVTNLDSREPIIYHGFTLTTKLPFRDVIHAIKEYAFTSSIYPLIISIENHCNKAQQAKMAKIFRAIFDEMLPEENLVELEGRERLPSPQELQGKIILKGSYKRDEAKPGTAKKAYKVRPWMSVPSNSVTSVQSMSVTPTHSAPTSPLHSRQSSAVDVNNGFNHTPESGPSPSHTETDSGDGPHGRDSEHGHYGHSRRFSRNRRSLREIHRKLAEIEQGQDDQELAYEETVGDLKSLIIYAKATSIKPWDWKKQKATTVTQMFSFGEPTANQLCSKWTRDVLACTERQLVRTYPKGTRFDSSNYDPLVMWRCGVQMVALNFQYPDIYMHLNQGFFRLNGGCGYVLKPAVMRMEDPGGARGGSAPFNPEMQVQHPDVPALNFEIELISGQRLCPWKKKCTSVSVEIHTYGITHDCMKMEPASHTNLFWPQWKPGHHKIEKKILMPELCLVYFRVDVDGKKMYGQNCIPLISLQPGIKFIPLRTTGGELIPESGLFVRINKEAAEDVQPSSLRMRSANLRRQEELNDEIIDPKTLSTITENEEDYTLTEALPSDVNVMQSINPIAFNQQRPKSPSSSRPASSPPLIVSYSIEDRDAEKEVRNLDKVVVVVDVNDTESAGTVEETDFQTQESHSQTQVFNSVTSSSKPRSMTIEANPESTGVLTNGEEVILAGETGGVDTVKEYRLQVKLGEQEKINF